MVRSLLFLALLLAPATALAQPVQLGTRLIADGFSELVFLTAPAGDPRLFVVEQTGTIRIVADGKVSAEPFLDITALVRSGGERGLLGLAFDPDYARDGRFYVNYTDTAGDTQIVAYTVSADPAVADPESAERLLSVDQPYANHNGGWLGFGPDGKLYVGMGDGGSGGDPQGNGQNPKSLLGKILQLDSAGGAPAIFATGVRNPWRIAFDGNDVYVADVGQNRWEEVTVIPFAAGANLGWNEMEGQACFKRGCDPSGKVLPQHVYSHDEGCSITGGYVYRGAAIPAIQGQYFFADYCSGRVWSFAYREGKATALADWTDQLGKDSISSFGVDAAGELYILSHGGEVWQVVAE